MPPHKSFAGLPVFTQLDELEADIAIVGLHYQSPYPQTSPRVFDNYPKETAPDAIRRQSSIYTDHLGHYDIDFNDTLLGDREIQIIDCGDVDKQVGNAEQCPEPSPPPLVPSWAGALRPSPLAPMREMQSLSSGPTTVINRFVWYTWMPISIGVTSGRV